MKKVLVSTRVFQKKEYNETWDCLDQKWADFLEKCKIVPIIVPNSIQQVKNILDTLSIDGILLTGGNSLVKYGGDAPERDLVEDYLIEYSLNNNTPLLGVCRGMQSLQDHFNVSLSPVTDHVKIRLQLEVFPGKLEQELKQYHNVNSYHNFGALDSLEPLAITSRSQDQVVMSIEHTSIPLYGLMWHPEREKPFNNTDIQIFKTIFGVEL